MPVCYATRPGDSNQERQIFQDLMNKKGTLQREGRKMGKAPMKWKEMSAVSVAAVTGLFASAEIFAMAQ